jgi:hypothetical protein
MNRKTERFWTWLAWKLPRPLVYWAAIRLLAHATTGRYGSTIALELTAMDALRRWDEPAVTGPELNDRPPSVAIEAA